MCGVTSSTVLDWLNADLQPTEQQLGSRAPLRYADLDTQGLSESPEDRDWEAKRARFMNGVLHFEDISV